MRITCLSSDSEDMEVYESLDELAAELEGDATDEYREEVLNRIKAGEKRFVMPNGPGSTDLFVVE